jgi:DedD protein
MATPASEDTEITLGTGKMLALFFGLVILCAVFFGMGFSLGKNTARPMGSDSSSPVTTTTSGPRPSAVRPNTVTGAAPDSGTYKTVVQKTPDPAPPSNSNSDASDTKPAVSKQEDADALVDALKRKQYPALAASLPTDKLFHVEVGPFGDIKEAETMRSKLQGDGYNPILKK